MKANELRIGNYVTLDYKQRNELFYNEIHAQNDFFKVTSICEDGIIELMLDDEIVDFDIKDIKPIPITEELLLGFGFDKFPGSGQLFDTDKFYAGKLIADGLFKIDHLELTINYVHELQNLYFALTEEELTIKDND